MRNLVEQASEWLQSKSCKEGSIIERTSNVIASFRSYVETEMNEISTNVHLSSSSILEMIDTTSKSIYKILSAYLRGNHHDAHRMTRDMVKSMRFDTIVTNVPLYKCRENTRQFLFSKDEMYHIPYDKRHLVGNQRFSMSGLPCLYLGGSSYICWEELERKDLNHVNFCGYSVHGDIKLFDLLLPSAITNEHQIRRIVIILACSLPARREDIFKTEYVLPQCVLNSLIYRSYYSHKAFCIRYYSSHLLCGDADYFKFEYDNQDYLSRYVNYVFPMPSSKNKGYNDAIRTIFNQTDTISLFRETILDPSLLMSSYSTDTYLNSQFGLIDSLLDVRLGIKPKRREGQILIVDESKD